MSCDIYAQSLGETRLNEVLNRASLPSSKSILMKMNLRWL